MTLIIAAANKDAVLLVADTRLTRPDGSLYDDCAIKTIVLHCWDAKLVLAYTGLAIIEGKRTDRWLVSKLREANASRKAFLEVVELLRDQLTRVTRKNSDLGRRGLTLVVIGLGHSPNRVRQPAVAVISNVEEPNPERGEFRKVSSLGRGFCKYVMNPNCKFYISITGAVGSTIAFNSFRRNIVKRLKTIKTSGNLRHLLNIFVTMLRVQRRDFQFGKLIGNDCMAVAMTSDFRTQLYFYGQHGTTQRFPHIIRREFTVENFTINRSN